MRAHCWIPSTSEWKRGPGKQIGYALVRKCRWSFHIRITQEFSLHKWNTRSGNRSFLSLTICVPTSKRIFPFIMEICPLLAKNQNLIFSVKNALFLHHILPSVFQGKVLKVARKLVIMKQNCIAVRTVCQV